MTTYPCPDGRKLLGQPSQPRILIDRTDPRIGWVSGLIRQLAVTVSIRFCTSFSVLLEPLLPKLARIGSPIIPLLNYRTRLERSRALSFPINSGKGQHVDAFEQLVAEILWMEGYWVRTSVKVELTKEEKRLIGLPSAPRWEVDVVAYNARDNFLRVVECKSYFDSVGVRASAFDGSNADHATRYKLASLLCHPVGPLAGGISQGFDLLATLALQQAYKPPHSVLLPARQLDDFGQRRASRPLHQRDDICLLIATRLVCFVPHRSASRSLGGSFEVVLAVRATSCAGGVSSAESR